MFRGTSALVGSLPQNIQKIHVMEFKSGQVGSQISLPTMSSAVTLRNSKVWFDKYHGAESCSSNGLFPYQIFSHKEYVHSVILC